MSVRTKLYTTQLQAGLGLIQETRALLNLWHSGMNAQALFAAALAAGVCPGVTARRLRNIVLECFAPRYLIGQGAPARHLQLLVSRLPAPQISQFMLLFTVRANRILGDFIREVYWPKYSAGATNLVAEDARSFVLRALDDGRMSKRWSETTVRRVSAYLLGACADYGLLRRVSRTNLEIVPLRISDTVAAYLAYDLHYAGMGDTSLLNSEEWRIFGITAEEVLDELKRVSLKGHLIVQTGGGLSRLSWKYFDMDELCHELN